MVLSSDLFHPRNRIDGASVALFVKIASDGDQRSRYRTSSGVRNVGSTGLFAGGANL
jgi:hypothetical protein